MLAAIVVAFSSCGIFRKTKSSTKYSIQEVSKRDCVLVNSKISSVDIKERQVDRGTTVTDRTTTSVTEKGGKSKLTIGKDDLKPGDNVLIDSAGHQVKAVLDTLGRTLTLEINIPAEKTTTITNEHITDNRDHTTDKEQKEKDSAHNNLAVTSDQKRDEKLSTKVSESKPSATGIFSNWIGWTVCLLILICGVIWVLRRK